ncbi:cytochrome c [Pseudomaricurvus alcaniphilus]|uniref:c-type cytochrome n=1 Tax=Pseudomaricurvus alcaniphilus TaxID=1166482 RepID=UPI001A9E3E5C|nr:cytochrome c [Pseudomaricurvus alcaniphilus]NHN36139.1 cytochrome c [Pseudomaricurvus alcaniphilus]
MKRKLLTASACKKIAGAAILLGAASSLAVQAVETKDIIKHRHGVMEAIGGHFSSIFATLGGPQEMHSNFQFHADSIARLAKISVGVFPAGSGEGKTDAKAAIWEKPEDFQEAMDLFLERSETLAAVAKTGDPQQIAGAAKKLGGSCKGCHDDFKKKD